MRVTISDSAPGFGPARDTYLEARFRRVFEPYASRIEGIELGLGFAGVLHEGSLVLRMSTGAPFMFRTKGRRMTNVLANLIDAAEQRLAHTFPSVRVREEAS